MRICDIFFAIPGLILAMAFVAAMNQITSLTIPLWLGILFPIFVLAAFSNTYLNSTVPDEDQIIDQAMSLEMRNRSLLWALVGILFFLGVIQSSALGWFQVDASVTWRDFFEISESTNWRVFASLAMIAFLGAITLADRKFFLKTSFEGGLGRIRNSFDWTNPWRYLTFRTLAVFVSLALLFSFSGNEGEEIVLIKDFDRLWKVQAALIFTGWPGYARLIRGQVLYVKEMTFVEAARSVGARPGRIMFRHILPNAWAPLLVAFTLDIGGTILSASGLSFLGLGADAYTAEWGLMISESRRYFLLSPHLMLYPGLAIAVTVLGFNLLGDGIRDVVDPKNRR
ncbi:MAG: ABC transporter permease, partial [Pseudomonadota bacterium]|nr:ABC transporter permease [Pseudomonadota bacterium]